MVSPPLRRDLPRRPVQDDAATEQDLIAMALLSWTGLENISPATIVEPAVMPAFNQTARDCLTSVAQFEALEKSEKPLQTERFLKIDPTKDGALERDHGAQLAGSGAGRSTGLYAQGSADTTVDPQVTKRFAKALCAQGVRVSFVELPGVSHIFAARDAAPAAIRWMNDRFRASGPIVLPIVLSRQAQNRPHVRS